jgi:hypothetical protein
MQYVQVEMISGGAMIGTDPSGMLDYLRNLSAGMVRSTRTYPQSLERDLFTEMFLLIHHHHHEQESSG